MGDDGVGAREQRARPLWAAAEALRYRVAAAPKLFAFFDYDGTLCDLAASPGRVRTQASARSALRRLIESAGTRVAIVSGRPLVALRRRLPLAGLGYIGLHGLEVHVHGLHQAALIDRPATAARVARLQSLAARFFSHRGLQCIIFENKRLALALHTPSLPAPVLRFVGGTFAELARQHGLEVITGKNVVEARPPGLEGGIAVRRVLAGYRQALPVYVGDDATDEDAFRALGADGITVRVAPAGTATRARYLVHSVADVIRFIHFLADARKERTP